MDWFTLTFGGVCMGLSERLVYARRFRLARALHFALFGADFPPAAKVGKGLRLVHRGQGIVVHPRTTLGNDVRIYHQVTLGRKDAHLPLESSRMEQIVIEDGVVIFPGAKILAGDGITTIGAGTIIAANAVVTCSTGPNEIWAGVPARKVGTLDGNPVAA
jgi:serine O-acetyltransferase